MFLSVNGTATILWRHSGNVAPRTASTLVYEMRGVARPSWVEGGNEVTVEAGQLRAVAAAARLTALEGKTKGPRHRSLFAAEAPRITFVVGDQTGTTLVYFTPDYDRRSARAQRR